MTGSGDGARPDSYTEPDDGVVDTSDLPADAAPGADEAGAPPASGAEAAPDPEAAERPEPAEEATPATSEEPDTSGAEPGRKSAPAPVNGTEDGADTTTEADDDSPETREGQEPEADVETSDESDGAGPGAASTLPKANPVASGSGQETDPATGSEAGDSPAAGMGTGVRRGVAALAVFAVLLLGTTVWAAVLWFGDQASEHREAAALETARTAGAVLTSIDQATAEQDIQKVVDVSTGQFGDLFRSNTQAYVGVVREGAVSSTGKVEEAGLQSVDGDTAKALVAVSSTVKNKAVPEGEPRYYRMLIGMEHQDDGRWLVSQVEFVP
ncbi:MULTISPECIES: hypothetical protein [unclassified Pseudonocardia]|uniref:hypothetical protein n=1 Tax=unclassified Pseudonocardia TaxID=2619320 RepID=UPI0001FFE4A4|nr:hypothetical protein [Pseudonocardia sp. Ae707_Ps1]